MPCPWKVYNHMIKSILSATEMKNLKSIILSTPHRGVIVLFKVAVGKILNQDPGGRADETEIVIPN